MRPNDFKEEVKSRHANAVSRALLVESSPGIGKTEIVKQAAKELGVACLVLHAPLMQPEDYGMPVIHGKEKDQLKFVVSAEKFPLLCSAHPAKGILLLDEISQADSATQKILANLVQAREIHGHGILPGWTIVATGNRQKDRSGANRILGHLGNRVTRVSLEASLDDWTQWALSNGVPIEVISFIRFCPELLNNYSPDAEINATPRAWVDGVAKSMGRVASGNEFEVFAGDVGEGPATQFLGFLKIFRTLPNPDAILLDPKNAPVPDKNATSTLYALTGALTARATETNFDRVMTYMARMPAEFRVMLVRDSTARNPDICNSRAFQAWTTSQDAALLNR